MMLKGAPPKPYLRDAVTLNLFPVELFFDVEVDPLRGICYLHGFVERHFGLALPTPAVEPVDGCRT
jgi:hypothetical protein